MSVYRIVYTRPEDGGLSVIIPAHAAKDPYESELDFAQRIAAKDVPQDTSAVMIEAHQLPPHRHFRDAWKVNATASGVDHDMAKARNIHKAKLRIARAPALSNLDVAYSKADESGDSTLKSQVASQKQALRDLPESAAIESAATPEDLMALWPSSLPNPYV